MTHSNKFFTYSWFVDDSNCEVTNIRIYGIGQQGENICVRVNNFTPYIYLELPPEITWTQSTSQLVSNKIDDLLGEKKPLTKVFCMRKKLYGVQFKDGTRERQIFPYLFCTFSSIQDIRALLYTTKKHITIPGYGRLLFKVHEFNADPILQLTCCSDIPTAGWVKFTGKEITEDDKLTLCDKEYIVKWKNLKKDESLVVPPNPLIMSFDIEVNSTNPSAMPNADKPGDKVFQISCVFAYEGESNMEKYILTLGEPIQDMVGEDIHILTYISESELLCGFTTLIRQKNPNIICGYNILGFDIPYMIRRAQSQWCWCMDDFDKQGFHKYNHAHVKLIKWSSSAYKNQEFEYLDAEGRLFVDLLPVIKRDFKMSNYRLKTISDYFIGETKDPLSPKGIFKCYRIGTKVGSDGKYSPLARRAISIVAKYCVQDSALVVKLMDKLKTWVGLTEMANVSNVPPIYLVTKGQQIKVFSQVYKYCTYEDIVVENDAYKIGENERYMGATVHPPVPGKHEMVVPFDYASLYPTTIIAYNIDYHTWIPDHVRGIPDSLCHVFKWRECIGCEHDPKVIRVKELDEYIDNEKKRIKALRDRKNSMRVKDGKAAKDKAIREIAKLDEDLKVYTAERADIKKTINKHISCCDRHYRFLKEPKGVVPTILQNLLDARKHTRKVDMVSCKKKMKEANDEGNEDVVKDCKILLDVLDKRQLAYKVGCNSMYGAMGVKKGFLPFMAGAMCVTYMGRVNIDKSAQAITSKYGGKLIYIDTDSNYIVFPHLKTAQETWDHAEHVASEVTKLFPKPMELEFEQEIYTFFFILTKKRYMYQKCLRDGVVNKKIGNKGVLLARRDNSQVIRDIYEMVITKIADNVERDDIIYSVLEKINEMCSSSRPIKDFVVTKEVGDCDGLNAETFTNEKGEKKLKVGNYTIKPLPTNKSEREKALALKGAVDEKEYYLLSLPAQVQLAERMKRRGQPAPPGTRLEYVITRPDIHTAKQYEKIENIEYLSRHSDIIKVDYLYYLKALVNPLDQVMDVAFEEGRGFKKGFVMSQYKYRWKIRGKVLEQIRSLGKPKLVFKD
jgi:DNA polymerase elongation subunit (family B)